MGLKTGLGIFATLIAGLSAILSPAATQPARAEVTEEQAQILPEVADSRYDVPATEYAVLYEIPRTPYDIPEEESGVKRWMDYRAITDPTTRQWAIQQEAYTDEHGFRRYGGAYCVAVGTYYAEACGDVFEITLDSGVTFSALVSDIKRDCDTDETNRHRDGNVIEFIVDKDAIPQDAKDMGDMSYGTPMQGKITGIYLV